VADTAAADSDRHSGDRQGNQWMTRLAVTYFPVAPSRHRNPRVISQVFWELPGLLDFEQLGDHFE
jgi:hypothetical protein